MVEITRPLTRRSRLPFAHYHRRLIVTLEPGDIRAMRLKRTRVTYRAPLSRVFRQLAEWHAEAQRRQKQAARKSRS